MANRPIPVSEAEQMMEQYVSYMQSLNQSDQTQYISFTAQELLNWLTAVMPYCDEIRICEGLTPEEHPQAGKITAIIWPYKDGQPATKPKDGNGGGDGDDKISPYNDGALGP